MLYQFRINQGKKWDHNGKIRKSEHHNENHVLQYNIFTVNKALYFVSLFLCLYMNFTFFIVL